MTKLRNRYFSFNGRLARLPSFARSFSLSVAAGVIFFASIPLFSNGARLWWWMGLVVVIASGAVLAVGLASLIVRRLHDLGMSGYNAIWVAVADVGGSVLSYAPPKVLLLALPLFAINFWLTFWPGNKKPIALVKCRSKARRVSRNL
jgi:uncharacterized membrane protein YhaH (DUF805 family)